MFRLEAWWACRILRPLTHRTESIKLESGNWAVTAYWLTGGQSTYYTLRNVRAAVRDRQGPSG